MKKKASSAVDKTRIRDSLAHHRAFLKRAAALAVRPVSRGGSPHPKVKVGALLVDAKGKEIARGVNRFARGVDRHRPERYVDQGKSLWINCAEQIVLAEALRQRANLKGARLYVTLEPCATCAGLIAETGIRKVYVPVGALRRYAHLKAKWKQSIEVGLIKLAEAGVELISIDVDNAAGK